MLLVHALRASAAIDHEPIIFKQIVNLIGGSIIVFFVSFFFTESYSEIATVEKIVNFC